MTLRLFPEIATMPNIISHLGLLMVLAQITPQEIVERVDRFADLGWEVAMKLWEWAEPGYMEYRSAELLAHTLETRGFRVRRAVAEIPTAFLAEYGQGKPVIGLLGEYDALPGLSQQALPERLSREDTNHYGHGCGHHLLGSGSMIAALALAEQLQHTGVQGVVRYYGCPAEEGGAAKAFMVRDGLFDDCDIVLHWHPASRHTVGDVSNLARIAVKFRFQGMSAHAAGNPELGRSALDAVELTAHASELLREHTPVGTSLHHVITGGGEAPNVVPEVAEIFFYIRHPNSQVCRELYPRLLRCAEGAAHATETRLQVIHLGGTLELLPNRNLSELLEKHLKSVTPLTYSPEEQEFALRLQQFLPETRPLASIQDVTVLRDQMSKGSTDVGDVSWVIPTAGFTTACWVPGTPGHSWQAVACGGMSIGRKGMMLAARVLAATAWDLFCQPEIIRTAQQEHRTLREGKPYRPLLLPDQKPPHDYRKTLRESLGF